ncbi:MULTISPECIES: TonB-dependent receptor [unclassified Pseudoalteromonas]|uniref:TonB-dependent receptor n=1 Tax=unclassified Pseudoalteromonas TaxID=194690 RepID=UPI001109E64B|nr:MULTISPECIES: TonB-dependent receptor [unclassified Pseudoalteromonas]TMN82866.1 TonB-dependent receptor [Pseudoalteromonas sp. S410]TMN90319.1 TonB-dependent receptor [Pseudoalteromonas sp. S408]TMO00882.1 TonB-dependent receptor [Pseudoalteromonas sp. S407]TMO01999.1 TonB-dependent receptor [Pseudoalteromonas sp. S409]TMO12323.1 TonB-dependent receptor [Pseudoalteromonas sp. S186]
MKTLAILTVGTLYSGYGHANIEKLTVYGHRDGLIGEAISASSGIIGQGEIDQRPMLRSAEMLELIPGMAVTQHSGSGKANQYFIRGFNLDHGTDFATSIDGIPINMRSHGHGQGYTDLNFIIPESISTINYKKGSYSASQGDFSSAGSAQFKLTDNLKHQQIELSIGDDNYKRAVVLGSTNLTKGKIIAAAEWQGYDGPWDDINEDVNKKNALLRYVGTALNGDLSLSAMAYDNTWNSADQIPQRAVSQSLITQLGSLDTTLGGNSSRYSLSSNWQGEHVKASAYVINYDLNLYSNFSYFLNDPINGDQFNQQDSRNIYGTNISYQFETKTSDINMQHTTGIEVRHDNIDNVGLYNTQARERLSTVRQDALKQTSYSSFWESKFLFTPKLEATAGVRYDYFDTNVTSNTGANSGKANDDLVSFKGSVNYRFTDLLAAYANWGQSFHSNDARGSTINVDPVTGELAEQVDLLVKSEGAEVGLRFADDRNFNLSAALWWLTLDSELLFVGDAGNTEPSDASKRYGLEMSAYYWVNDQFSIDLEASFTHSRLDINDNNNYIEGAVPVVASAGLNWHLTEQWQSSIRVRHIGKRTLTDDGDKRSNPLTVVNSSVSYKQTHWKVDFELLNLFNSTDHDIDYYYASRLPGEPAQGVEDNHFHPIEPRTTRLTLSLLF